MQVPKLDPGSLLVKITASTLCGTDVHRWHGPLELATDSLPIITGHEPCGVIEEISGEGKETFMEAGGESFQQVPCLNDHDAYIGFLAGRCERWLASGAV